MTDPITEALDRYWRDQEERHRRETARIEKLLDAGLTEEQIVLVGEITQEVVSQAISDRDKQWERATKRYANTRLGDRE